jgi:hypothetical protein
VERVACEVALLDAFQPYFEYVVECICGIPEITLEGTTEDWERLRTKVDHLQPYDLDFWLPNVRHICDHFVRASAGDVDLDHWGDIYKQQEEYGFTAINGWIVQLVPYLKNWQTGKFTVHNPLLMKQWLARYFSAQNHVDDGSAPEVASSDLPSGVSFAPFRCQWPEEEVAMEFLGGFVGVTQDEKTLALRPKLGWAVSRASEPDQLLA